MLPRYRDRSLADVVPSLLSALGVPGMANVLGVPRISRIVLLLVDGMGERLLDEYSAAAPFLSSAVAEPITVGFPSTTAVSIASVGTGLTPGEHGIVGFTFAVSDDTVLNALTWRAHDADQRERFAPEEVQPLPTAFEQATAAGVSVRVVAPTVQAGSGLTRAVLRGGDFNGVHAIGDLTTRTIEAVRAEGPSFCYAYHADLDLLGHVYGPGSDPWLVQLSHIDRMAADIAAALPSDALLAVVADHGMITVGAEDRIDFDTTAELRAGVRLLGGEQRARHVYTEDGATEDVLNRWRSLLGERATLLRRDDAIAAGWFGDVAAHARPRIGDIVVAALGNNAITRSKAESMMSALPGQHGSFTEAEMLVPFLLFSPR